MPDDSPALVVAAAAAGGLGAVHPQGVLPGRRQARHHPPAGGDRRRGPRAGRHRLPPLLRAVRRLGPLRARGPGRRPGGPVRPQRGRPHWHGARLDRYRLVPLPYSVRFELRVTCAGVCCSARFLLLSLRSVASPDELSMTFAALADPTRRAILERRRGLRRGGHGTAELGRGPCALLRLPGLVSCRRKSPVLNESGLSALRLTKWVPSTSHIGVQPR